MAETSAATAPAEDVREHYYEGMFLLDSNRYANDPDATANELTGMLERVGATIEMHRPWQEGRLAYEIEGHRKGLHYLVMFRMPSRAVPELTRACKLNDLIVRHLLLTHEKPFFEMMAQALAPDGPGLPSAAASEDRPRRERPERAGRDDDSDGEGKDEDEE